jgi:hypothetical protein
MIFLVTAAVAFPFVEWAVCFFVIVSHSLRQQVIDALQEFMAPLFARGVQRGQHMVLDVLGQFPRPIV